MDDGYGLEIARDAGLASGTLYPILNRLEQARWLKSAGERVDPAMEERPKRRLFRLTGESADSECLELDRVQRRLNRANAR